MARRAPKPKDEGKPAEKAERKSKAKTAADNAPAKLDAATYQHHVEMIQARSLELDEKLREVAGLRGVLGSAKKAAKKAGVPADTVMKALALKKRPAGEVVAEYRDIGRILKVLDAPLGTQWGLFNEVEVVDVMDADAAGYQAGKNNEPSDNNPHHAGTEEHAKWKVGWDRWVAETVPGAKKVADPAKDKVEAEFRAQGADAYSAGTELSENPYGEEAKAHVCWREGWVGAQNAKAAAPTTEGEPIPDLLDRRKKRGQVTEGATAH